MIDSILRQRTIRSEHSPRHPETGKAAWKFSRGRNRIYLKNESNILPLNTNTIKNIAVIGNNATIYAAGGGS